MVSIVQETLDFLYVRNQKESALGVFGNNFPA